MSAAGHRTVALRGAQVTIRVEGTGKLRRRPIARFIVAWAIIFLSLSLLGAMALGFAGQARYHAYIEAEARV